MIISNNPTIKYLHTPYQEEKNIVTLPEIQQKVRLDHQRFRTCHLNDADATHLPTRNEHVPKLPSWL
jgi:hypothetical protein